MNEANEALSALTEITSSPHFGSNVHEMALCIKRLVAITVMGGSSGEVAPAADFDDGDADFDGGDAAC